VTQLTVERLFSSPSLNGTIPSHVRFSPDGTRVSYLANPPEDRERLDLYCYDVASATTRRLIDTSSQQASARLTAAEQADRERRRHFSTGVAHYDWLPDGERLCCTIDGAVYLLECTSQRLRAITPNGIRQTDLTASRAGRYLSYVRNGDLYIYDLELSREERLTDDASECISNGIAEFIAAEEMHRFDGHWWSANDRYLVFTRVDVSAIPVSYRYEFTAGELVAFPQRYPYAGAANATVKLGVFDLQTRSLRWIDYRNQADDYLARVNVGRDIVVVQSQSRNQRTLTVVAHPLADGIPRTLLTEQQPAWINLHNNFRFVGDDSTFLWTSERTGSSALYLYRHASPIKLGPDRGRVNEVVHADASQAWVLGWIEQPTEQHLYRVAYDTPGSFERLTPASGWHEATIDPTARWFVDRYSSVEQPVCLVLQSLQDTNQAKPLCANALTEGHPYHPYLADHVGCTFGRIIADDGQDLWYRLTLPHHPDAAHRIPVLVHVYGGPGVQRVRNEWMPLNHQLFAAAGLAVFELDNRGGGNRAKSFEDPIQGRLGNVEVDDQLAGIRFLQRQRWVDPNRIGVMGHSYGGFMSLMLLARSEGMIRAAVSTAPVTEWRLYDTHYTERYLDTPEANPGGYHASSAIAHIDTLRGALLLMHGMADDNVLFGNSTALMKALQDHRFGFELMLYPGAKHALQERSVAIHRYDTVLDFLRRKLLS